MFVAFSKIKNLFDLKKKNYKIYMIKISKIKFKCVKSTKLNTVHQ